MPNLKNNNDNGKSAIMQLDEDDTDTTSPATNENVESLADEGIDPFLLEVIRQRATTTAEEPPASRVTPTRMPNRATTETTDSSSGMTKTTAMDAMADTNHSQKQEQGNGVNTFAQRIAVGVVQDGPGAYAVAPQEGVRPPSPRSATAVARPVTNAGSISADPERGQTSGDLTIAGLVEADLALPLTELPRAQPYQDDERQVPRRAEQKRFQKRIGWSVFLGIIGLGIVMALVLVMFKKDSEKSSNPSLPCGTEESSAPTMAPSSSVDWHLDIFITSLPEYSRESLKNPLSDQSLALDWLRSRKDFLDLPMWRMTQLYALASFYYSFGGPNWRKVIRDNWMDEDRSECDWYSANFGFLQDDGSYHVGQDQFWNIDPCDEHGMFVDLALEGLNLSLHEAKIPPEISLLSSLLYLHLNFNAVQGNISEIIPSEVYDMEMLEELGLGYNGLTGSIPTQLADMSNLKSLFLDGNIGISGSIPSELHKMANLTSIFLQQCSLTGTIPSFLWENLTSMGRLLLGGNQFTGTVPTELALLKNLSIVSLSYNALSGTMPTELGTLGNMTVLDLENSTLTGTIPSEVGLLRDLEVLALGFNQITGTIPSQLGLLAKLGQYFGLGSNLLTGGIPTELFDLDLHRVAMFENGLTGTIPKKVSHWTNITELWLDSNMLSGMIPSELGLLTKMIGLGLGRNPFLTGSVPKEIGVLVSDQNLSVLFLEDLANVTGMIPDELCGLNDDPDCIIEFPWGPHPCMASYNCTTELCGCDCDCLANSTITNNTTENIALLGGG